MRLRADLVAAKVILFFYARDLKKYSIQTLLYAVKLIQQTKAPFFY